MTRTDVDGRSAASAPPAVSHDPRMSRSRQRALGATLDLIAERGIAGATIEAISARSGVAKTTIYRQWENQAALVLDAFRSIAPDPPVPDTGTLRGDLEVLVGGFAEALGNSRTGVLMAALMDAAQRDAQFADVHAQEARRRHEAVRTVLTRGVVRGELPPGTDLDSLVDRLAGPVLHRRFITGLRLDRDFGEHVVDATLRGL